MRKQIELSKIKQKEIPVAHLFPLCYTVDRKKRVRM